MTRILHIIPTLDLGGAEKQLVLLAAGLHRRGRDVHVCCLTRGGPRMAELKSAGVPCHVIGKRWKVDPLAFWRLKKHVAELRPAIVHTWLFAANCYGRAAALACQVPHIIGSERCVDPWKSWLHFSLDRYFARHSSRLVTNSPGVVAFYEQHGIDPQQFEIIPNGIQMPSSVPATSRDELLDSLGIPRDSKLIGAIGRHWPQKRIKDLIWAFDLLQCLFEDVHLLLVGDGPLRSRLERYSRLVSANDHVHFLGEQTDVASLLPQLSCFWLASSHEGQSNALMEAMAAGVPVVATDIPGNRDLVVNNESGLLVPVGDRAGFAGRTREILLDPAYATRLGLAAQERMATHFQVEPMIDRYCRLYDSLC